jgi:hypothetical protein
LSVGVLAVMKYKLGYRLPIDKHLSEVDLGIYRKINWFIKNNKSQFNRLDQYIREVKASVF